MKRTVGRRDVLHAGLAVCAALAVPAARACEFFAATLRVHHPWTRATATGSGDAVVCMEIDEVTEADRLIGAETPVAASAVLSGAGVGPAIDLAIPVGRETVLSEEGTHIRLVGLKHPLHVGRSYPLTLAFEKGGRVSTQLNVDYPPIA